MITLRKEWHKVCFLGRRNRRVDYPQARQRVNMVILAALADGMHSLRKIAQIEVGKRHEQELRQAYALERKTV